MSVVLIANTNDTNYYDGSLSGWLPETKNRRLQDELSIPLDLRLYVVRFVHLQTKLKTTQKLWQPTCSVPSLDHYHRRRERTIAIRQDPCGTLSLTEVFLVEILSEALFRHDVSECVV